jgi:hypothetical protein
VGEGSRVSCKTTVTIGCPSACGCKTLWIHIRAGLMFWCGMFTRSRERGLRVCCKTMIKARSPRACGCKNLWIHRRAGLMLTDVRFYKLFQVDWSTVMQSSVGKGQSFVLDALG